MQKTTAKEYLSTLAWREAELESLIERREQYRALAERCTPSYGTIPGGKGGATSKIEECAVKIADIEREINAKIEAVQKLSKDVENVIDGVKDERYQTMLRLRYVHGWKLGRVAKTMHYEYDYARKLHGKALRAAERVLDEKRHKKTG